MKAVPHTHIKIQMRVHRGGPKHWMGARKGASLISKVILDNLFLCSMGTLWQNGE